MVKNIDAVYDELLRLKNEGVDQIFINSDTTELIRELSSARTSNKAKNNVVNKDSKPAKSHTDQSGIKSTKKKEGLDYGEIKLIFPKPTSINLPCSDKNSQMDWLRKQMESCSTCNAQVGGNEKIVFGSGNVDADIFFCCDAPNEEEAKAGIPFTGSSGDLMLKVVNAMGLNNDSFYTTHIVKWRPKHHKTSVNRDPNLEEIEFCAPYLQAQIAIVMPKVIIALGKTAVVGLTNRDPANIVLKDLRGKWERVENIPTIFTYHPTYLLHNNTLRAKRQLWEDMLEVMKKLKLPISDKQKEYFL
ncbi:MAG: uracil-DNA glycosylase [Saprospiraceae bacterium]|nr:uracil-DNA glycosylase [Saprospiraceae bacterium]